MKRTSYLLLLPFLLFSASRGYAIVPETVIKIANLKLKANDFNGAVMVLESALKKSPGSKELKKILFGINKKIYLTEVKPDNTLYYKVKRGDTLLKIARRYCITSRLIKRLNKIKSDMLMIGQRLKVVRGPFDIRVIKKTLTLEVMKKGKVLFTYPVGIGKDDSTPTGKFVTGAKLIKPTQFDRGKGIVIKYGSKNHTIGTRWITFSGQYGIHGTVEPESIGKKRSKGCIRMLNKDVEELFDLVVSKKSRILIVDSLARA